MCGIAGVIDPKIEEKGVVTREMVSRIFHRGPDEDGFFIDENVALGMRRLSIIDLSTGKQPIWSQDKKKLIFFNGEIYNYLELREELLAKGHIFDTQGDTEVILHMFEEYGEKMLPRLRGMFTFCIYNIETSTIFIARDFFGIKPLYYLMSNPTSHTSSEAKQDRRVIAFSSEIKSFLSFPGFKALVNDSAVYNYLSFQYNPLDETFFKNVYKLPPAHYMRINVINGDVEIKKYWSFEIEQNEELNEEETSQKIYQTVRDSVAHHMIADVPVGSFLSGGVDSSIIATLMQEIRCDKKIKTFTVGFDTLTEGLEASDTSDFLGTDHTEIKIGPDEYFNILPKAVWHFDEPVADPSAIGLYFVAREARKHVTVVLSGEGADELFGGYNIYLEPFARRKISWIPNIILNLFLRIPYEFRGKNYLRRASKKMSDWYIGNASIFNNDERDMIWKSTPRQPLGEIEKYSTIPLYQHVKDLSQSAQMQYIDVKTWLIGDILAKADKMTMANSLELRVPFLDKEVSDLATTLPDKFKWRASVTKYLLRKAFKDIIPESTRNRKKLGFPTPVRDWFTKNKSYFVETAQGKQDVFSAIITNEYIKSHMDVDYIQELIANHIEKKVDNSRKIYLLLMLALWYNVFILKNEIDLSIS